MKPSTTSAKRGGVSLWAVAFWLLLWQAAALWLNAPILLASPVEAVGRLFQLVLELDFWRAVLFSLSRILMGFALSVGLGVGLGALSYRFDWLRQLLSPLTATIKAVPVASFVILALLWVSGKNLAVLVSLLIGFPVIYSNVLAGLDSTDEKLIEMTQVFRVPFVRRLRYLYWHQVTPFLRSGLMTAIGLCWKSGIAAEVIGIPNGSIGERLYTAKIYLQTPDLFCWTLVVVLLSVGCEKLLSLFMRLITKGGQADA